MSATVPNIGVRVCFDPASTIAVINACPTYACMCPPASNVDPSSEMHKPVVIAIEDPAKVALLSDDATKDVQLGHIAAMPH